MRKGHTIILFCKMNHKTLSDFVRKPPQRHEKMHTFMSLNFLSDEMEVTSPEIIAIQIKYNPFSYSCPSFCCHRLQEKRRDVKDRKRNV